jgi:hypothetical protein
MSPIRPAIPRARQLCLFVTNGPLTARLGAGFFRSIPSQPGVYFFYDSDGRLLYIGQSHNLRIRIGSYRFVTAERQARRTARLVRRIHHVEWRLCETPADALALEKTLLLENRPPFNRAGVWQPPPCWITIMARDGKLHAELTREPAGRRCIGPLPSSFRYTFSALMRCTWRWLHPGVPLWGFPPGITKPVIPPQQSWILGGGAGACARMLRRFVVRGAPDFPDMLSAAFAAFPASPSCEAFWIEELETLRKFAPVSPAGTARRSCSIRSSPQNFCFSSTSA